MATTSISIWFPTTVTSSAATANFPEKESRKLKNVEEPVWTAALSLMRHIQRQWQLKNSMAVNFTEKNGIDNKHFGEPLGNFPCRWNAFLPNQKWQLRAKIRPKLA